MCSKGSSAPVSVLLLRDEQDRAGRELPIESDRGAL